MKPNLISLSQQYVNALRKHLEAGPQAGWQPARELGQQAIALGLETLELARMHDAALVTLELSGQTNAFTKLAGIFFYEANRPIEETHHITRTAGSHLKRLMSELDDRTEELAVSKNELRQGVVRHKAMEKDFAKRRKLHQKSLEESVKLQKRLRQLTHRVMAEHEDERKKISRELQDEIAQTLLGINVRLLTLKQGDRDNAKYLQNEIANTQKLVVKSARSVRRYARTLDAHRPAPAIHPPAS